MLYEYACRMRIVGALLAFILSPALPVGAATDGTVLKSQLLKTYPSLLNVERYRAQFPGEVQGGDPFWLPDASDISGTADLVSALAEGSFPRRNRWTPDRLALAHRQQPSEAIAARALLKQRSTSTRHESAPSCRWIGSGSSVTHSIRQSRTARRGAIVRADDGSTRVGDGACARPISPPDVLALERPSRRYAAHWSVRATI